MIKITVLNMSCGHCKLKINAELQANGFEVVKIDMDQNSVLINATKDDVNKITSILDEIHYVLDERTPVQSIEERRIWQDALEHEVSYNKFSEFIQEIGVDVVGFDDENFALIVFCSDTEYAQILEFLTNLS